MSITAADLMKSDVHTVRSSVPLSELEQQLVEHRVSGFPVVERGAVVGVVSRSDVIRALDVEQVYEDQLSDYYRSLSRRPEDEPLEDVTRAGARIGARVARLTVGDVMMKEVVSVPAEADVVEVARLMKERGIHRVLVTRDGALLGIISSLDLVGLIAEERL